MAQVLDEDSLIVVKVVASAQRAGHPLSSEDFIAFASSPRREPDGILSAAMSVAAAMSLDQREPVQRHLLRARLVAEVHGKVVLTSAGEAVLRCSQEVEEAADIPQDMMLPAGSEWARFDLLRIAQATGSYLLVDPWAKVPHVAELARYTQLTRLLIGPGPRGDFSILKALPGERSVEIHVSEAIHDRHVIPDAGPVLQLGQSVAGVGGVKPTTLVRLTDEISKMVRDTYEALWRDARTWEKC